MKGIPKYVTSFLEISNLFPSSKRANRSKVIPGPDLVELESDLDTKLNGVNHFKAHATQNSTTLPEASDDVQWSDDQDDDKCSVTSFRSSLSSTDFVMPWEVPKNIKKGDHSTVTVEEMRRVLFAPEFNPDINDITLINELFHSLTVSGIYGPQPNLPFTLDSFIRYLFEEAKDFHVIRMLLSVCQESPTILMSYDQKLRSEGQEYGVREMLLVFFVGIRKSDDVAARRLLQLMGFKTVTKLKNYLFSHETMRGLVDNLTDDEEETETRNPDNMVHKYNSE